MPSSRALVIVPTYNEIENLKPIVDRILHATDADVLVVDDGSPDGTGDLADSMSAADPRVSTMHRTEKGGLGAAYLAGFDWAFGQGYELLVQIDADGSHPPEKIPEMIAAVSTDTTGRVGGVIGSRWVAGGSVVNWPKSREFISRGGSLYARIMLGLKVRDVTAGFRVYRSDVLQQLGLDTIESRGYCFQIDMTRRLIGAGYRTVEVPIEFRERELGDSKMSRAILIEAMVKVTQWGADRVFRRKGATA